MRNSTPLLQAAIINQTVDKGLRVELAMLTLEDHTRRSCSKTLCRHAAASRYRRRTRIVIVTLALIHFRLTRVPHLNKLSARYRRRRTRIDLLTI